MIEPTDEMIEAFNRGKSAGGMGTGTAGPGPGIAAVLAIVERDYDLRPRPDARCARPGCGHTAGQHRDSCVGDLMFCPCPKFVTR